MSRRDRKDHRWTVTADGAVKHDDLHKAVQTHFNELESLFAERLHAKGRKPAGTFSFVGYAPIASRHIKELAEIAGLQAPPEDRWSELAHALSQAFYFALAQRDDRDDATEVAQSGVFNQIAITGRKFLSLLQVEIEDLRDGIEPEAVRVTRSGIILQLARDLPQDTIAGALCGVKSIVTAAERIKIARGPRRNIFAARLLEELAWQFRATFGSWPVLKNKDRERDPSTPGARWLRAVCACAMPARPPGVLKLPPQLEVLFAELTRIKRWKNETLIGEFERAVTRAKRR